MSPEGKRPVEQKETKKRLPPPVSIVRDILVRNETSRNGRPLDERAALRLYPASASRFSGSMELTPSPYKDSREDKDTNYSAFRAMGEHWQDVLDGFAWINGMYFQGETPDVVTAGQFGDMTLIAEAMPSYAFNRATAPFKRFNHLPDEVADIYKASRGLTVIANQLVKLDKEAPVTSDLVYTFADKNGYLVGKNDEACAAPPQSIKQVVDALLSQKKGDTERSKLNRYFPDPDNLKRFSSFHNATNYHVGGLIRSSADLVNSFAEKYYKKRLSARDREDILARLMEFHVSEETALLELTDMQVLINFILGRQTAGIKPPVVNDIKDILQYDPFTIAKGLGVDEPSLKMIRATRGLR